MLSRPAACRKRFESEGRSRNPAAGRAAEKRHQTLPQPQKRRVCLCVSYAFLAVGIERPFVDIKTKAWSIDEGGESLFRHFFVSRCQLGTHGRWAFAEFTEVYQMQHDFGKKVETEFRRIITGVARYED